MTDIIVEQIMAIRDTGLVNMCSGYEVQQLAYENDFFELVCFIEEHPDLYLKFILTGNCDL